ncbi:MAG: DNA primase [Bacillota bacterium]
MASISRNLINNVKAEIDIVALIDEYVDLKKTGKNYQALCPFHQENTPSFTVNPQKQFYYCFGCGAGGDAINFVMEIDNLSFKETLITLAERVNIEVDFDGDFNQEDIKKREAIFSANKLAAKFYNYLLINNDNAEKARDYLFNRGYSQEDIDEFQIGYAPNSWKAVKNFLLKKSYNKEILYEAGLVISGKNNSYYDRFRNRIIFPIYNVRSEVIGFGGRRIDPEDNPKYLNSPESPVFSKKRILYGLNNAKTSIRETGEAIIVEGYTDVLTAHKLGLTNFVASLGTSLTREQAGLLKRYADKVFIAYDSDTAGELATLRGLEILRKAGLDVAVINLPEGSDPDDFLRSHDLSNFEELKDKAPDLIEYRINLIMKKYDDGSADSRLKAAKEGAEFLADLEDELIQEAYAKVLADKTDISMDKIENKIMNLKKKNKSINRKKYATSQKQINSNKNDPDWQILAYMLQKDKFMHIVFNMINPDYFTPQAKEIAELIWQEPEITVTEIISCLDQENKENLTEFFLTQEEFPSEEVFKDMIDQLIKRKIQTEINIIIDNIQQDPKSLSQLNDLLLYYKRILRLEGRDN